MATVEVHTGEVDMQANHFMETDGRLDKETGQFEATTKIGSRSALGGWNGGVSALFEDADGFVIGSTVEEHVWGVDGRKIGRPEREIPWSENIDPNISQRTVNIRILHFYNPNFGAINNILGHLTQTAKKFGELWEELKNSGVVS